MKATGNALLTISDFGGPLCCKRDSIASIESYIKNSEAFADVETMKYVCDFSKYNKGCLGFDCPYFPKAGQAKRTGQEGTV